MPIASSRIAQVSSTLCLEQPHTLFGDDTDATEFADSDEERVGLMHSMPPPHEGAGLEEEEAAADAVPLNRLAWLLGMPRKLAAPAVRAAKHGSAEAAWRRRKDAVIAWHKCLAYE